MSWNEWTEMNQLKWMNWHEGIEMNGLTFLHEWIDMNELQGMNCQKSSDPLSFLWFLSEIELSLQSRPFCRPHRPKWSEAPEVFYDFMWSTTWWRCGWHMKSSSRYSLVHILSPHLQKVVRNCQFFCDVYVKSSSRYSFVHILPPHLQKVVRNCQFFCDFYVKPSSRYSFVHILSTTFRSEARNRGNRDPPGRPRTTTSP